MNSEHLIYIPRRAKIGITLLAVFVFLISVSIVFLSIFTKADAGLVSASLTLAQTCAAGLSVIALIFYTKLSVSVGFLRDRTASYLVKEIPEAFRIIDYNEPGFQELTDFYFPKKLNSNVKILIRYNDRNHYCQYRISAYGLEQRLYVQVNVKRIVISYFIDERIIKDSDIKSRIDYVTNAAEIAGYSFKYESIHDSAENSVTTQLRLFRTLSDEFLMNSGERLYIANDLASMTRALIRALPNGATVQ